MSRRSSNQIGPKVRPTRQITARGRVGALVLAEGLADPALVVAVTTTEVVAVSTAD